MLVGSSQACCQETRIGFLAVDNVSELDKRPLGLRPRRLRVCLEESGRELDRKTNYSPGLVATSQSPSGGWDVWALVPPHLYDLELGCQ